MGLATIFHPKNPQGFFIPYRHAAQIRPGPEKNAFVLQGARLDSKKDDFLELISAAEEFVDCFAKIGRAPPPAPRWDQDWFSGLDAVAAYTLIRTRRPARLVEIGSGHSTRFLAKAASDGGFDINLITIDPAPRTSIDGLAVTHLPKLLQDIEERPWLKLERGDVLSVDSSHVLMPGTDVDFVLNQILPVLPPGVLVHFHDTFLPDTYPPEWHWRGYNEQQAVAVLLGSGSFQPIFASHYLITRQVEALSKSPLWPYMESGGAPSSSLWLEKTET